MPVTEKKKLDLDRKEIPKQLPEVRKHNFNEVALGYSAETAVAEAKRCIKCPKPKCVGNCPVEINIPGFIAAIADGDFSQGVKILKQKKKYGSDWIQI